MCVRVRACVCVHVRAYYMCTFTCVCICSCPIAQTDHMPLVHAPFSLSIFLSLPPPPSLSHPLCPRLIAWSPSCGHSHAQSLISEDLTQLTFILCIIIFTAFLLDWFMLELSCTTTLLVSCWPDVKECRLLYQPLQNILLIVFYKMHKT